MTSDDQDAAAGCDALSPPQPQCPSEVPPPAGTLDQSATQAEEGREEKAQSVYLDLRMGMSCSANEMLDKPRDKLMGCFVLGYDLNGQEYIDCNIDDGGMAIWLLERAKYILMAGKK